MVEKNGKGKEYTNGFLTYIGDYLDGKKHGKGKEYSSVDGKVIFDGAYFYNYRIAGKEYNNESHLI